MKANTIRSSAARELRRDIFQNLVSSPLSQVYGGLENMIQAAETTARWIENGIPNTWTVNDLVPTRRKTTRAIKGTANRSKKRKYTKRPGVLYGRAAWAKKNRKKK